MMRTVWLAGCLVAASGGVLAECSAPSCSNDPLPLGDEALRWSPAARAERYEVARVLESGKAEYFDLTETGTACVAPSDTVLLAVRACNAVGCSGWSEPVEFGAWACVRQFNWRTDVTGEPIADRCEAPCYAGAPLRFAGSIAECAP